MEGFIEDYLALLESSIECEDRALLERIRLLPESEALQLAEEKRRVIAFMPFRVWSLNVQDYILERYLCKSLTRDYARWVFDKFCVVTDDVKKVSQLTLECAKADPGVVEILEYHLPNSIFYQSNIERYYKPVEDLLRRLGESGISNHK